jgi:hypothetical protein
MFILEMGPALELELELVPAEKLQAITTQTKRPAASQAGCCFIWGVSIGVFEVKEPKAI